MRKICYKMLLSLFSAQVAPSRVNASNHHVLQDWKSHHLFHDMDEAESFLGVLDACFLGAYSVVSLPTFWNQR